VQVVHTGRVEQSDAVVAVEDAELRFGGFPADERREVDFTDVCDRLGFREGAVVPLFLLAQVIDGQAHAASFWRRIAPMVG
jgi:hypothetical protein